MAERKAKGEQKAEAEKHIAEAQELVRPEYLQAGCSGKLSNCTAYMVALMSGSTGWPTQDYQPRHAFQQQQQQQQACLQQTA